MTGTSILWSRKAKEACSQTGIEKPQHSAGHAGSAPMTIQAFFQTFLLIVMISLTAVPLSSGCSQGKSTTVAKSKSTNSVKKKSALPVANPEYPGDYKTVEVDGVQLRQGRFPVGKHGGTLVRSTIGSDPKTFNPWASSDTKSSEMAGLMFASLLTTDMYTGDVVPYMAESFKVEDDGITYTTTLRKGLTWSDGKPITSADVEFTWNEIIAKGYGNASIRDVTSINGKVPQVTSLDSLTNKYVTAEKFAPFLRTMGEIPIAPKHIVAPILKNKNSRKVFQGFWGPNVKPTDLVTSGPFILERFVPSQRVEFKRQENFFMVNKEGKKLPYLDRLVYTVVPDVQANLLKFKGKEIDITQTRSGDTYELMKEREKGNFSLNNLGQSIGSTFMMFNLNRRKNPNTKKPYVDPVKSAWFNDVNFRQAVNHILNREIMVANYFKGLGYPAFTAITPASPFFNNKLKAFQPDPEYAMELLTKSGFKKNVEGKLEDSKGNPVEFDLITMTGGTFMPAVAGMAIDDMKKLGMKVNYQEINFNILIDKVQTAKTWDACLLALSGDVFEPNGGANVYRSDGRLHFFDLRSQDKNGTVKVTDARDWEKQIDELFSEAATTLDKSKRKELYDRFQKIIYDQAPFIYYCDAMTIVGARNTIKNYEPTQLSQPSLGLHNIEEIWKEDAKSKD